MFFDEHIYTPRVKQLKFTEYVSGLVDISKSFQSGRTNLYFHQLCIRL